MTTTTYLDKDDGRVLLCKLERHAVHKQRRLGPRCPEIEHKQRALGLAVEDERQPIQRLHVQALLVKGLGSKKARTDSYIGLLDVADVSRGCHCMGAALMEIMVFSV